jgi:hypothetical protein
LFLCDSFTLKIRDREADMSRKLRNCGISLGALILLLGTPCIAGDSCRLLGTNQYIYPNADGGTQMVAGAGTIFHFVTQDSSGARVRTIAKINSELSRVCVQFDEVVSAVALDGTALVIPKKNDICFMNCDTLNEGIDYQPYRSTRFELVALPLRVALKDSSDAGPTAVLSYTIDFRSGPVLSALQSFHILVGAEYKKRDDETRKLVVPFGIGFGLPGSQYVAPILCVGVDIGTSDVWAAAGGAIPLRH